MKRYFCMFLILFVIIITLGCDQQTLSPVSSLIAQYGEIPTMPGRMGRDNQEVDVPKCIIVPELPDRPSDYFVVQQVSIQGDIITFTLSYSGGCSLHNFQLISTTFKKSHPLQVLARVLHNSNGDLCDRWITEEREFDLSPLKEYCFEVYDTQCGTIRIDLVDDVVSDFELTYRFCKDT